MHGWSVGDMFSFMILKYFVVTPIYAKHNRDF